MRVCIVSPYGLAKVSGISSVIKGLAGGLVDRGHAVYVAAPGGSDQRISGGFSTWSLSAGRIFANASLTVSTVRILWRNRRLWDILHLNQPHLQTLAAALVARILGRPFVTTFHLRPPRARGLRGLIESLSISLSIATCPTRIFVSEETRSAFDAEGIIVHNGVDAEWVRRQLGDRETIRGEVGLGGFIVVFSGRHAKNKGFLDLLHAVKQAREDGYDIQLLTTGEASPEERDDIEATINRIGLREYICRLGDRTDHLRYLAAGDAFALPSYLEGLPIGLLEAMAAGLPVLGARAGGVPEVVTDGVEGFLTRPGDISALKLGLERLATDPDLRESFGTHSRERADAFSQSRTTTSYLQMYDLAFRLSSARAGRYRRDS